MTSWDAPESNDRSIHALFARTIASPRPGFVQAFQRASDRPYLYLIGTLISEATGGLPRALGTPLTYPTQVPALEFHTLRTAEYSLFTLAVRCSMHL